MRGRTASVFYFFMGAILDIVIKKNNSAIFLATIRMPKRITIEMEISIRTDPSPQKRDWSTLEPVETIICFSMYGGIGAKCGGQIYDSVMENIGVNVNRTIVRRIIDVWKKNHLNDIRAGTKQQMYALQYMPVTNQTDDYKSKVEFLKQIGIYEDRGYTYGDEWLYEEPDYDNILILLHGDLKIERRILVLDKHYNMKIGEYYVSRNKT